MFAALSWLLASATALHGPVPTRRTRRACIARASPVFARLGELLGNNDPLQALDTIKPALSYGGWQQDAAEVEDGLVRCGPSVALSLLAKMRRKQRLHGGDRSDVELQVLDEVKQGLTYDGWEKDVGRVERDWVGGWNTNIHAVREKMRRKQRLHEGDRSDVVLQVLDDATQRLTYAGWEVDVARVERDWTDGWDTDIQEVVKKMRRRQLEYAFSKLSTDGQSS